MEKNEITKLANSLKENNNIGNKILGTQIEKRNEKATFDIAKDGKKAEQIKNKTYKLFLKLIDKESSSRLIEIDNVSSRIVKELEDKSGWYITDTGAFYESNFTNQGDPEFKSHDTYRVPRDKEEGFYLPELGEGASQYEHNSRRHEETFYSKYIVQLNAIHELWAEKEKIMGGNYNLSSTDNYELASMLAEYLGYEQSYSIGRNLS